MAIDFSKADSTTLMGRPTSTPHSLWQGESETPFSWVFPTIISLLVVWALIAALAFRYSQDFRDFLKKHFNFGEEARTATSKGVAGDTKTTAYASENEVQKRSTTTVSINSEKMSVGILLLCLFLPIFAPIIALFRGKFLLLVGIIIAWIIAMVLLVIPVIGIIIAIIVNIIVAVQVAKSTKKTEVVVNN